MQLMKSVAFLSLAISRHSFQHVSLDWHRWLQKFRVPMHFLSCWQVVSWLLQYFSMHSWGVPRITASFCPYIHPFACAHLAVSIAASLPFEGRQRVQQDTLDPHFFSQSSRAGWHFGSLLQAAHCEGHLASRQATGSFNEVVEFL